MGKKNKRNPFFTKKFSAHALTDVFGREYPRDRSRGYVILDFRTHSVGPKCWEVSELGAGRGAGTIIA